MQRPTGKQLCERTTSFGDKLEIYFVADKVEYPFTFVINECSQFPCSSFKEAEEMYEHFYTKAVCEKTETNIVERVAQYAH